MDPVSLVLTALAAGAGAGTKEAASSAVKDAYAALKGQLRERLAGKPKAELALSEYEASPQVWKEPLSAAMTEVGVDNELRALAQQLLDEVKATGQQVYSVHATTIQGLQQGEGNVQNNTFGS